MGLPGQTIEDLASTVDFVTGLNPQHISAYSLTVEDGTVLKESGFVVDEDGEADMYDVMSDILNKKATADTKSVIFVCPVTRVNIIVLIGICPTTTASAFLHIRS